VEQGFGGGAALEQELSTFGVPPSQRRAFMRYYAQRLALGAKLVPGDPRSVGQQQQEAVQQQLVQTAREIGIEVNPRYGRWNTDELRIEPAPSGGLARPVEELRDGGTPTGPPAPSPSDPDGP
jgi:hypothetical protein